MKRENRKRNIIKAVIASCTVFAFVVSANADVVTPSYVGNWYRTDTDKAYVAVTSSAGRFKRVFWPEVKGFVEGPCSSLNISTDFSIFNLNSYKLYDDTGDNANLKGEYAQLLIVSGSGVTKDKSIQIERFEYKYRK
jgi:hypothetical protein